MEESYDNMEIRNVRSRLTPRLIDIVVTGEGGGKGVNLGYYSVFYQIQGVST